MTSPYDWPLQRDCDSFYGNPRNGDTYSVQWAKENLTGVHCPWVLNMGLNAQGETFHYPIITVHKKCAESLERVLNYIWDCVGHSQDKINSLHYHRFDGSFNYRPMRGGTALSMHSYGVALDWDAAENPFHSPKHLYKEGDLIVKAFDSEEWTWGGRWSNPDWMHFQAARVH